MTLKEADDKAEALYGNNVFCAIDGSGRCEIFYKEGGSLREVILLGRGDDWEDAFDQAGTFSKRFYPSLSDRK